MSVTQGETEAGLTPAGPVMTPRHKLVLVLLLGTQFMLSVDFSILNVALPAIGHGVGLSFANLQWVATAFALPAAGFTLLFGRVADLLGRRRMFLVGLAMLAAASLVGGLATSPAMLLTGRVAQGMATAVATPAALSLLVTTFPEGPPRERALGLNGALLSAGFTVGALVGGVLTDLLSWRWAFLVNVPFALLILAAVPAVVAEARGGERTRLDLPGAITVTGGLLALVFGVADGGRVGWGGALPVVSVVVGAALLVAFWFIELRSPHPLASVRVLRRRTVGWGNLGGFTVFAMETSVVFLTTLYLQQVLGYPPLSAGLAFGLPGVVAFITGVLIAPRLIARYGSARCLPAGIAVQGLANAALLLPGQSRGGIVAVGAITSVVFLGHITGLVAFTVTATSGLPDDEQGLATGLSTMTQQAAITLGIPILSSIATARTRSLPPSTPAAARLLSGLRWALSVDVGLTLLAAVAIAAFLRGSLPRPGHPSAAQQAGAVTAADEQSDACPAAAEVD